ncbi:MAG TPA: NAD-dependent epimerase/dehydratase family protein [Pyrinomonadaceae bacterium]
MQHILVTGGFGLLGSRLLPLLKQLDAEVITISRRPNEQATLTGDLRDEKAWQQLPNDITHVFHLAAAIPWTPEERQRTSLITDNLLPITNLIERSESWPNLKQVIYSSSISVYTPTNERLSESSETHPPSLYGSAKFAGEEALKALSQTVRTVSLRFSSIYGRGQNPNSVLPLMVQRANAGQPLLVFGDGSRTQDYLHGEDAARALITCFQKEASGTYNVGFGTPTSMLELAQTVSRVFGDVPIELQPEKADNDRGIKLDVSKIKNELDFEPQISLERGLQQLKREITQDTATE